MKLNLKCILKLSLIVLLFSSCETVLKVQQSLQTPIEGKEIVEIEPVNCKKLGETKFKNTYFSKKDFDRDVLLNEKANEATHAYLQDYKYDGQYHSGKATYYQCAAVN
jgi:hypothetical protein